MTEISVKLGTPRDKTQAIYKVVRETFKKVIDEPSDKARETLLIDMDNQLESMREEMPMNEFLTVRANAVAIVFRRVNAVAKIKSQQPSEEVCG